MIILLSKMEIKIPSILVESKVDLLAKEEQMMKKLKNLLKKWI